MFFFFALFFDEGKRIQIALKTGHHLCCTLGGMTADYESRDVPYNLQYALQVSCMG